MSLAKVLASDPVNDNGGGGGDKHASTESWSRVAPSGEERQSWLDIRLQGNTIL